MPIRSTQALRQNLLETCFGIDRFKKTCFLFAPRVRGRPTTVTSRPFGRPRGVQTFGIEISEKCSMNLFSFTPIINTLSESK